MKHPRPTRPEVPSPSPRRRTSVVSTALLAVTLATTLALLPTRALAAQYCDSPTAGATDTCYGSQALANENTDGDNSAFGYLTLQSNTSGTANTASGAYALSDNLTGGNNTALGTAALRLNTSGGGNTATGEDALTMNLTGWSNTADGNAALTSNTSGGDNTAMGSLALGANSTGYANTASGDDALFHNTTGAVNTAEGDDALGLNTTGSDNTALGYQAGVTDDGNGANTTGSDNTFIGYNSGFGSSAQLTNATAIGAHALVSQSNSLVLGATGTDQVNVGIGTASPQSLLQVGSTSTTYGSYLQLPLVSSRSGPPPSDCNSTTFVGRLVLQERSGGSAILWVCGTSGKWVLGL